MTHAALKDLLPCPFACGESPRVSSRVASDSDNRGAFVAFVTCYCGGYSACAYKMGFGDTDADARANAITAWNRRAALSAMEGEAAIPPGAGTEGPAYWRGYLAGKEIESGMVLVPSIPTEAMKASAATIVSTYAAGRIWENMVHAARLAQTNDTAPPPQQADKDLMQRTVDKVVAKVMGQREEILQAFVAKYGFQPDEAVQVIGHDGSWRVIRREEMSHPTPSPGPQKFPHEGLPADFPLEILDAAKEGTPDYWLGYLAGRKANDPPGPQGGGRNFSEEIGSDGKPTGYLLFDSTPPAHQPGEVDMELVEEGLRYFEMTGDKGDERYTREIRKAFAALAPKEAGHDR